MDDQIRRQMFIETFSDHEGLSAVRYGAREGRRPFPPEDWTKDKIFCFQVYVTCNVSLDGFSEAACAKLADHLIDLEDSQVEPPIWEFYTGYRTVLDCVSHARLEIACREPPQPPLRRLALDEVDDSRRLAFLFIVDKEHDWDTPAISTPFTDKSGPLWVYFDPRVPATVTTMDHQRMRARSGTEMPDQIEMMVSRPQNEEAHRNFTAMYSVTVSGNEDEDDEDYDVEEGLDSALEARFASQHLPEPDIVLIQNAQDTTSALTITHHDGITLINTTDNPELKYIVSVTFDCQLEQIARLFTASVMELTDKTFHFEFYNRIRIGMTDVGILTNAYSPRATRRLFPIDHNPNIACQDPETSANPYGSFLIILDRPDFTTVPAVRLHMSEGRPQHYTDGDYNEMQCWRCPDMQDVVDRITLKDKRL